MLVILVFEIFILALLYFYSRSRFVSSGGAGNKKNIMKAIMEPISFFVVDTFITGRFIAYERKLGSKLSVLYGGRNTKVRIRAHIAGRIRYLTGTVMGMTLLGALMDKPDIGYGIFAILIFLIVFYIPDWELEERIKKRNFLIQYDFPDFLNKLVLLVNAGMTVPRAFEKIVVDRKKMTPLYEELNITFLEIRNGKPEIEAYEDFAKRCRVKEITKFITTIIQNLRKGNNELVTLLKLQSNECWQLRKSMARRLGEEASTKLVLPLMIMFVGIIVIVILPAVLQLRYL